MNCSVRLKIVAPLALMLAPAAQAGNAAVCQKAKRGHAAFTDDYRYFVTAFTAENTDDAELGVDLMRDDLRSWRNRVRNIIASTRRGVAARKAVLTMIKRSRDAVLTLALAVGYQQIRERDAALDAFIGGQRSLARAAALVQPRLRAINCGY